MKTLVLFLIRCIAILIFEWVTYLVSPAQTTISLNSNSRIVASPHSHIFCNGLKWVGDGKVVLKDSCVCYVTGLISGFDNSSRFFALGNHASLKRKIVDTASYVFPVGYSSNSSDYRGFTLNMKSLGATGPSSVALQLVPNIFGGIYYEKYFPSSTGGCVSNSWVSFNCLNPDGWHCDGPSDYEYSVSGYVQNTCGVGARRIIKTATGTNAWQDSIEGVVGSLASSFCTYSDWSGSSNVIPGGTYKNFSDFTVVSGNIALPVTLVSLHADPIDQKCIRIFWKTELELNNEKFLVGRSTDGVAFSIIGERIGHGTTTVPEDYTFDDCTAEQNVVYYYQLEQIDYDGHVNFSPLVSAKIVGEEILETKTFNILGQEVAPKEQGIIITKIVTKNGIKISKTIAR